MAKKTSILGAAASICLLGLASCSDMDNTQQRMLSGGAIGAGVGAVGGYVYDQVEKNNNSKTGSSYNSSGSGYQGSGQ